MIKFIFKLLKIEKVYNEGFDKRNVEIEQLDSFLEYILLRLGVFKKEKMTVSNVRYFY